MIRWLYGNTSKAKEAVRPQFTHNKNAEGRPTLASNRHDFRHLKAASASDFEGMKPNYAGNITIFDDEGEVVFERELTHDEMIQVLLNATKVEPEVFSYRAVPAPKKKYAKRVKVAEYAPTKSGEPKPCCGSLGRRHYKTCSRSAPSNNSAPSLTSVGKSLDEADKAWREFEPALTPLQFSEIKDLAIEQAMNSVEIIGELNLPADQLRDVNFVIQSKTYQTYLSLARKAALG